MRRLLAVIVVPLFSLVLLSGCIPSAPVATPSPTGGPTASAAPSDPAPSMEPTDTSEPVSPSALASDCTQLLTAASLAEFDGTPFGLPDAASITAYVDKTRAEGSPLALFVDGGGLLCPITNGTRVSELFGFSPITPEAAAEQKARLVAEGHALSPHAGGELYSDTSGQDGVVFEYLFAGDYWFSAIDVTRLDEVVANSGAVI